VVVVLKDSVFFVSFLLSRHPTKGEPHSQSDWSNSCPTTKFIESLLLSGKSHLFPGEIPEKHTPHSLASSLGAKGALKLSSIKKEKGKVKSTNTLHFSNSHQFEKDESCPLHT
jgi:hypothetical protein